MAAEVYGAVRDPWHKFTCASIQLNSASLSERQSIPRGPLRQLLNVMGISSASGRYATSLTSSPRLRKTVRLRLQAPCIAYVHN